MLAQISEICHVSQQLELWGFFLCGILVVWGFLFLCFLVVFCFPPQNISLHFPSPFCSFLLFTSFPLCSMQAQWKLEFSFQNCHVQMSIKFWKKEYVFSPCPTMFFAKGKMILLHGRMGKQLKYEQFQQFRVIEQVRLAGAWRCCPTCPHKAGSARAGSLGPCPLGLGASPRMETPSPLPTLFNQGEACGGVQKGWSWAFDETSSSRTRNGAVTRKKTRGKWSSKGPFLFIAQLL